MFMAGPCSNAPNHGHFLPQFNHLSKFGNDVMKSRCKILSFTVTAHSYYCKRTFPSEKQLIIARPQILFGH